MNLIEQCYEFNYLQMKLLYDALPLAFLAEKAAGLATDGVFPILKRKSFVREQRTHLYMGSSGEVNNIMEALEKETIDDRYLSTHGWNEADEISTDFE